MVFKKGQKSMIRKTFYLFLIFIYLCLILSSCSDDTPNKVSFEPQISEQLITDITPLDPPKDSDIVSKYAAEDFLMPLNEYSWDREYPVECVVLHFSSNVLIDKNDPYSITGVRKIFEEAFVSANYIIDRDGTVYCWIPEQKAAWHAGKGTWLNNEKYENKMNKYSIGIEMLAIGSKNDMKQYLTSKQYDSLPKEIIGYTEAQYEALDELLKDITDRWNIPRDRRHILGHEEYKPSKSDPGELFDWDRVMKNLNEE